MAKINNIPTETKLIQKTQKELEQASRTVYEYAKIAVNQIICLGGKSICQPCQNRDKLAEALNKYEEILNRLEREKMEHKP